MEKCIAREPPVPAMMMRKIMMMINTMKIDDHDDHDEKDNAENSSCQPAGYSGQGKGHLNEHHQHK